MRPRDISFNINARMKDRIVKENEISKDLPVEESKMKLEEDSKNRFPEEEMNPENSLNLITFPVPQYKGFSKDFSKSQKPIKIHERGYISKLDPKFYEYFSNGKQPIDFVKMAGVFENEEQINEVTAETLLDINFEKYGEFSEKLDQFILAAQNSDFKSSESQNEVLTYLQEKKTEVDMNLESARALLCNVDKIEKIEYGDKSDIFVKN